MAETLPVGIKFTSVSTLVSEIKIRDGTTAGQIRAMQANAVTLIPAPGANKAIIVERVKLVFDVTTTGYTESNDNLMIQYGDGTPIASLDTTGFIDQTSDQVRHLIPSPWGIRSMGVVTQATSKATGVTLNTTNGVITMHNANLLTITGVGFTVTNSTVGAGDVVIASIASGATADAYTLTVDAVAAGSFRLSLRNHTVGTLGEAVVINFMVLTPRAFTPVANATVAIVNSGDGEFGSGNAANTLTIRTEYKIVDTIAGGI